MSAVSRLLDRGRQFEWDEIRVALERQVVCPWRGRVCNSTVLIRLVPFKTLCDSIGLAVVGEFPVTFSVDTGQTTHYRSAGPLQAANADLGYWAEVIAGIGQ